MVAFILAAAPAIADPLGLANALPISCTSRDPAEVVVCGSRERNQRYRLPKLSHDYDRGAIRAETKIAGMPARIHVDTVDLPGGQRSNRLLLTVSTGF